MHAAIAYRPTVSVESPKSFVPLGAKFAKQARSLTQSASGKDRGTVIEDLGIKTKAVNS